MGYLGGSNAVTGDFLLPRERERSRRVREGDMRTELMQERDLRFCEGGGSHEPRDMNGSLDAGKS